jgi:predicted O-methyltransferase YrrM
MQAIGWRDALSETSKRAGIFTRVLLDTVVGGNLAAARFAGKPRKFARYANECLFLYGLFERQNGLPQANVWKGLQLPAETENVNFVMYPEAADEWFPGLASLSVDLVSLCALCRILRPKVVFEIGTFRGAAILHLVGNSPDAEAFTLDLAPSERPTLSTSIFDNERIELRFDAPRYHFAGRPEEKRIHCLYGDSAQFDFSPWAQKVDLFFIDGAHSYEYVRNDTLKALSCCRAGSVLAWHDYGRPGINGVSKWLHEFRAQGREIFRVPGGSVAYARV